MLHRLLAKFRPAPVPAKSLLSPEQTERLREEAQKVLAPVPPPPPKIRGRVIKQTRNSEFNPDPARHGGRIVKVMPRKLQKIKAAQEMVESDDKPSVEDLEE